VGVYSLPMPDLLTAAPHPAAPLEAVLERGGAALPDLLGFRLRRRTL
jgi:hypothetical protein